ncbi:nitrogen fixation/metabolism regulation signal transduction histidine kinase [Silvibacterium bohemicum]|uniref:histidine kinase n=1 Tax=Silvibacterium bohemicum TaxID=1577686 RepID=A0A841JSA1_9BACT|nr:ATP-binding protein [Silvibacterium bohemicum]MBB6143397.1 nitrogen fixation/metabolism regulation signal transduction histidine kinase [Silvibacterium bohemicum]
MASRARAQNKKHARHNSGRLSFELKLQLFAALLSLPTLGLMLWLMIVERLSLAAILSVLTIAGLAMLLAIAAFMDQVVRPLQTLANVVAALREEDYSFRARGAKQNDPFGDLAIEINALADMHQAQRLGALEAAALFRRVITELDAPVLAFDQHRALRLMNPAAERLFQLNSPRDLGRFASHLRLDTLLQQPDEGILQLDGQPDSQGQPARSPTRWMVRRSTFRQHGEPHTLLLLSDVSSALREEERIAWRRLIRVLGHEISNSLAPIKSIAGSLRSRLPQMAATTNGDSPRPLADFDRGLGVIESRAESLNRFVQAYRQLAQLPAPQVRRVAVTPLLERVVSLETRLEVALEADTVQLAGLHIAVDPDQMEQLLINLVRNGAEAAFSVIDELIATGQNIESPQVTIRVEQQGEILAIVIEDNGPGITNPSNLFVPFYTTKKSGSGVGLALARQIAEAHGGTLELHNRVDAHGCQAELRLALAPEPADQVNPLPENQPASRA